ncbi:oligosaccharide flippase family protein [Puniceibacterium confluentis]|uniref:oligosaccharide flippase family protein n=1 Tax=Puniceibacterium confluentis TaxID=1958944 RepID=UPI0011B5D9EC|nr:oligosaccharide flippase family protein [Puniceibacterium confluentis]
MFRSALLILSGNAAAALLLLARNLIVARLIPVADYGVAATFAIAMAVVEMMSQLGLQQQIVQAKNGEDPRFQAALQGFQVLRGVLAGAALFVLAAPLADFLNVPGVAWAYQVMALVPVANALTHFDVHRLNRSMVFWPVILTGAVPALLSVLAVWPLAYLYGDYRVMLYAIVVQAVVTALTSHLVARRPYRLLLDRAVMAQSLRFGWPLLANGVLLFAVFQGDKVIVGRVLGMEVLAIFAMGFTLTLTPTLVMAKSAQNFFLPQLSAVDRDSPEGAARFQSLAMVAMQVHMLCGVSIAVLTVLFGPPLVHLLLGPRYEAVIPILTFLAVMQTIRVFKGGPSTIALAWGMTGNAMVANLARVGLLPVAWWIALRTEDLYLVIAVGVAGECIGFVLAFALVRWRVGLSMRAMVLPVLTVLALVVFICLDAWMRQGAQGTTLGPVWTGGVMAGLLLLSLATMRDFRQYAARGLGRQ